VAPFHFLWAPVESHAKQGQAVTLPEHMGQEYDRHWWHSHMETPTGSSSGAGVGAT
jgi:hypothetical protein